MDPAALEAAAVAEDKADEAPDVADPAAEATEEEAPETGLLETRATLLVFQD